MAVDKAFILKKIEEGNATVEQIKGWVTAMPGASVSRTPIQYRKGDVLMHPVFRHPYVLLKKKSGMWICTALTSEPTCNEILEPCVSRFFATSFFTRMLFTVQQPSGTFMNVYDNHKQLISVREKLQKMLS